jgi:glycosyltransferase involved in cell wall biosynthesis
MVGHRNAIDSKEAPYHDFIAAPQVTGDSRKPTLSVLQVILNLDVGGAQEVVRTLVKHLASEECIPIVCTFKDGPLRQEIETLGVKVEFLPPRRHSVWAFPWFIADMFRIWRILARLVKTHNIDVVQTHLLSTLDFLALQLLFTTRAQVVLWTFHSANLDLPWSGLSPWPARVKSKVHRYLYKLASHVGGRFIAVSDQVEEAIARSIGPGTDKIHVICNGVDLGRFDGAADRELVRRELGLESGARLVAMLGTLKEGKGHRYMIDALAAVSSQHPQAHVIFIGDGNLRGELEAQAAMQCVSSQVHFLGMRRDIPRLLASSDLFVLPSLWEGLSMALLEAMAAGLPVVASRVSGTVQVVTEGKTGYLVSPGNVTELAAAVARLLAEPEHARTLGEAARQRVRELFSAEKQACEHLQLYRRLVSQ